MQIHCVGKERTYALRFKLRYTQKYGDMVGTSSLKENLAEINSQIISENIAACLTSVATLYAAYVYSSLIH